MRDDHWVPITAYIRVDAPPWRTGERWRLVITRKAGLQTDVRVYPHGGNGEALVMTCETRGGRKAQIVSALRALVAEYEPPKGYTIPYQRAMRDAFYAEIKRRTGK